MEYHTRGPDRPDSELSIFEHDLLSLSSKGLSHVSDRHQFFDLWG